MLYETQKSDAPEAKYVDNTFNVQFKSKNGEFTIYNRKTKEKTEGLKSIKIIGINDERFRIQESESVPGVFMFSGIYKSPKQKITIIKSSNGKTEEVMSGTWSEIKDSAKAKGLKYTRLVYCLVEVDGVYETAIFELRGIAVIQFGELGKLAPVQELKVSDEKNFETGGKYFYSMQKGEGSEIEDDTKAMEYLEEVKRTFESEDARYKHFKNSSNNEDVSTEDEDVPPVGSLEEAYAQEIDTVDQDIEPSDLNEY